MKFNFWLIFNWVFYLISLIAILFLIRSVDWGSLESLEVLREVGIVGGLLYIGSFFWDEIKKEERKVGVKRI